MTIHDWLFETMKRLGDAGVDSPRRDALVLLEDTLGHSREWVLANPKFKLDTKYQGLLEPLIKRRSSREPLAYIRGKAWFYGRFFVVTPNVMIPRPESEDFIDILKQLNPEQIIDVGTGSGCLAISAKLELPTTSVVAIDIDSPALEVARANAKKHKTKVKFLKGDLLGPAMTNNNLSVATLVANLPYVPDGLVTSPEIKTEPVKALFSGRDGLDHYRRFWTQVKALPATPQYIAVESLENQHDQMRRLAELSGFKLRSSKILVQLFEPSD